MPRVWYGFGRLAHQVLRPPSRRGEGPHRRRQAAARGRRDRRQREDRQRVLEFTLFLFYSTFLFYFSLFLVHGFKRVWLTIKKVNRFVIK